MAASPLRHTSLYERHVAAGGKLVEFAGWELPVEYAGVISEHRAVRGAAGLFDVSHMGEIRVAGDGAEALLQALTPNDVARLAPGQAHYSGLLTPRGTYVDDLLVYRWNEEEYLLVVNAANRERDFAWIRDHDRDDAEVEDVSESYALLALQGPRAAEILAGVTDVDLASIRYYRFARGEVAGRAAVVSRTGYTGEDGFEIFLEPTEAAAVWDELLREGREAGLVPAGLAARDTLRLEAGMALYGHELDDATTPLEAGLDWVVKLDKGSFLGRDALLAQRASGVERKLVGFEVRERGIARQGYPVVAAGRQVGRVTSGTWSPTFEKALGMAYVAAGEASGERELAVEIRGRKVAIELVELPFYRRRR